MPRPIVYALELLRIASNGDELTRSGVEATNAVAGHSDQERTSWRSVLGQLWPQPQLSQHGGLEGAFASKIRLRNREPGSAYIHQLAAPSGGLSVPHQPALEDTCHQLAIKTQVF